MQDFWAHLRSLSIDWAAMEPQLLPTGAATLLSRLERIKQLDISCLEVVCAVAARRLAPGNDGAGAEADIELCAVPNALNFVLFPRGVVTVFSQAVQLVPCSPVLLRSCIST